MLAAPDAVGDKTQQTLTEEDSTIAQPEDNVKNKITFAINNVTEKNVVEKMEGVKPTPIQAQSWPALLAGADVVLPFLPTADLRLQRFGEVIGLQGTYAKSSVLASPASIAGGLANGKSLTQMARNPDDRSLYIRTYCSNAPR